MSVHRGQEKKPRESSSSRKQRRDDGRPTINQEKAINKGERDRSSKRTVVIADDVKKAKRKTEKSSRKHEPEETRRRNENSLDPIYLKNLLEKKLAKKSEGERKGREEKGKKNARGEDGKKEKGKNRADGTRTRTLSPTEVKQLIAPRAETGSGDAGGGVEEYEEDFEDYESDFEEESIQSAEAGGREGGEAEEGWKKDARRREMEEVRESIAKENDAVGQREKSTEGSTRSRDDVSTRKEGSSRRKRGEELLNMISLDAISYNILEIPPIAYEDFMRAFGRTDAKQVSVQTNEDDLDEEIQTDEIRVANKWTQNPPEYLGTKQTGPCILTKEERLGVGGDVPAEEETATSLETNALWKFLSWASQMVLMVLERKSGNFLNLEDMPNHSKAVTFGDGFVNLNVGDVPFLKGKSVTRLCVLHEALGKLLSVHVNKDKSFQKTMLCLWSLRELSKPLRVLIASNRVSSCSFGPDRGNLVFAGLSDGSICLWDLREPAALHNRMTGNQEWSLQPATYTTAGNAEEDGGHRSPVVAVRVLDKADRVSDLDRFTPVQMCSLDEGGGVTIWNVVQLQRAPVNGPLEDVGLAHWGRVKLVRSSSFSIFASLRDEMPGLYITCSDVLINEGEGDALYVSNSMGTVYHCSSYGHPLKPKFYLPARQDAIVEATCLELCPFNADYFLVGCGDGSIRLHSRHQENPLICLNKRAAGDDKETSVVSLSWMRTRPCVFFALDSISRINIWDLRMSDLYPEISLLLTERRIVSMNLVPVTDPRQVPFIVIGTEGGSIEIHRLKKEFGCRTENDVKNEMKMFLKYVSIL